MIPTYIDEVDGLLPKEAAALGKDFEKFMTLGETWSSAAWANKLGKHSNYVKELARRHSEFAEHYMVGMEHLANRIISRGMEGGADRWMLKTLAMMHDKEICEFEKEWHRFQSTLGKQEDPEMGFKVDRLTSLMQIAYEEQNGGDSTQPKAN